MSYRGVKQRVEQASLEAGPAPNSALAEILLHDLEWGYLTATSVQKYASAAVKDGANHPHLKKLEALGTSGQYPNRCRADLKPHLVETFLLLAVQSFTVPLKFGHNLVRFVDQSIILPHVFFFCHVPPLQGHVQQGNLGFSWCHPAVLG